MSAARALPPQTWAPVARAARALASPIQRMLAIEAASGVALLATSLVALVWANVWSASYEALLHTPTGFHLGPWAVSRPIHFWINEGLMTVFFFVVGLEIRREVHEGDLMSLRQAALPVATALGGMLVPAGIFAMLNAGRPTAAGWAIPMATDIAFAVGVLTLLGSRVPPALRILLLGLAVIDDIGAIFVIAIVYSPGIAYDGLALAATGLVVVALMRAAGVRAPILYVPAGAVAWVGLLVSGIHPTIAGVVLGLMTPVLPWFGPSGFAEATQQHLEQLPGVDRDALLARLDLINRARCEAVSPGERLIHALRPWVAFGVMPIFALANAGVVLRAARPTGESLWLFIGIVAGLVVGKPLGIVATGLAALRLGVATTSVEVSHRGILLVGLVGGIGFTMSLFIAQLAFPPGPMLDTAKLAILVGSASAIVVGTVFGGVWCPRPR